MKHLPINDFLTIQEAAKKLRVSTKTLRRWEAGGKLVPIRTAGGHRRYTLTQIEEVKKPKAKDIFKSFLTPPEISTSKIAEIAKEEARKEVINYKFWSLDSKDLTKVNEDEDQNKDLEILNNLYKITLPNTRKLFGYYVLGVLLLIITFTGLKFNLLGRSVAFLSARNSKIAQIFDNYTTSFEANTDNMRNKVLADTTSVSLQSFNIYVETNISENLNVAKDLEISGGNLTSSATTFNLLNQTVETLNIGGNATTVAIGNTTGTTSINNNLEVSGTNNDISGTLNLSGNSLTSSGDLLINPTGGGVAIGENTPGNVDMAGGDFFVTGDLEIDGTAYIPTLAVNSDTITDLTGAGLTVSSGALQTTLGTAIESSEITDGTIAEADLNISNSPTSGYALTYNASTAGFTWTDLSSAAGAWTDSGTTVYLTTITDSLVVGGTTPLSSAKVSIDGNSDQTQLLIQGNTTQTSSLLTLEQSDGTDILNISNTGTLSIIDGGFIDLSTITHNDSAPQGLRLPQNTSFVSPSSGEGYIAWDTDDSALVVYDGSTWQNISGGGIVTGTGSSGEVTYWSSTSGITGSTNFYFDATNELLGIGTGSPTSKLQVAGSYSTNPLVVLNETGLNPLLEAQVSGTPIARITNSGNFYLTGSLNTLSGNLTIDSAGGQTTVSDNLAVTGTSDLRGNISNSTGDLLLDDTTDIGSATTGISVSTTGEISDIDGNLTLNDNTDISGNLDVSGTITGGNANVFQVNTSGQITTATNATINDVDISATGAISDIESLSLTTSGNTWTSSGNLTISGDLAVNGGDITTTTTGLNIDVADTGAFYFRDGTNNLFQILDGGNFGTVLLTTTGSTPATCTEGELYANTNGNLYYCEVANTWIDLTNSGGNISGSGSSGQIAYWDGANSITGNNNFYLDPTDYLLGLGTNNPAYKLHVTGTYQGNALAVLNETGSNDILAASSSGTTVARITNGGNILLTGTLNTISGNLIIDSAGGQTTIADNFVVTGTSDLQGAISNSGGNVIISDTVDLGSASQGIEISTTGAISDIDGDVTINDNVDVTAGLDVTGANLTVGGANFSVNQSNGNITTAGTVTLPNSNTLTGVASYTQFGNGISVGGATTYYLNSSGNLNANQGTFASTLDANGQVDLGDGGDAITISGTTVGITSNGATNDITLTSADDIIFDDLQLSSPIQLTDVDTSLPNSNTGIVDAINDAYNAAIGGGGGTWSISSGVIYPTTISNNVAIGTSTTAEAISKLYLTNNSTPTGKALAIFNQNESQDIFSASSSGTPRLTLTNAGNLQFQQASSITTTTGNLTFDSAGSTVFADDLIWSEATPTLTLNNGVTFNIYDGTQNLLTLTDQGTTADLTISGNLIVSGGTITSAATANLLNTVSTEINFAGAATTLNVADAAITGIIDIGGVTNDGASTISIATNNTSADIITIGNDNAATTLSLSGGDDWTINANGTMTLSASGAQTTALTITSSNYTNALSIADNNITGTTANIDLNNFDVIGSSGNITTAGDLALNGGDLTSTATTFNFDVANTGTIQFRDGSNILASVKDGGSNGILFIGTATSAPGTCTEGELYTNSTDGNIYYCEDTDTWIDITPGGGGGVTGSGAGNQVAYWDSSGSIAGNSNFAWDRTNLRLGIGQSSPITKLHVGYTEPGKALVILDELGTDQNILSASASGTTVFNIDRSGNLSLINQADIRFYDSDGSNYTGFQAPSNLTTDTIYNMPTAGAASPDYVLTWQSGNALEWKELTGVGGAGDINAVGDVSSGPAFTGADLGNNLWFEGSSSDTFEVQLTVHDPTFDSLITLPAQTGYVALLQPDNAESATKSGSLLWFNETNAATPNLIEMEVGGSNAFVVDNSGNITTVNDIAAAGNLAVNGDNITSDGNLTINATGYTRIGDTGTPNFANGDDDLYIEGDLEVDGNIYDSNGNILAAYWSRNSGVLSPTTTTDAIAATTSATTVATFTATSSNSALRVGGASAGSFLTVSATGVINLPNGEAIDNSTADDIIAFIGNSGADNTDLYLNLDGAYPILYSNTDTAIGIDDDLTFVGDQQITTTTGDLTIDPSGNLVINTGTINTSNQATNFDLINSNTAALTFESSLLRLDTQNTAVEVTGTTNLGDGGTTDYAQFNSTGDLNFNGAANTITGPGANGLTVSNTSGALTLSTLTSGQLTLTSAGVLQENAGANLDVNVTGTYTMDSSGTFSIDGVGASNVSATSGDLTLSTITSGTLTLSSAGAANLTSAGALGITTTGSADITLTSADDIIFDDLQLSSPIQLTDVDTSLPNSNTGIVDAINDAYNAAIGGSGGVWTLDTGTIYPTTLSNRVGVGTQDDTAIISKLYVTSGATQLTGKALAIFNQTESQDILTASVSGTPRLTITNAGNLQFHQASSITTTTGNLTLNSTGGTTTVSDNLAVTGTSDLQGAISSSTGNTVISDTVDLGSATQGIEISTAGVISDLDGNVSINDSTEITGNLDVSGTLTSGTANAFQVDASGNISISGTTGLTFSGNEADILFSETGTHSISASSGTLQLGAATLGGTISGNSQTISGLGTLSFGTGNVNITGTTVGLTSDTNLLQLADNVLTVNGDVRTANTYTLEVGGLTGVTYNAFANATDSPEEAAISSDNDLYIGGDLEVDGVIYGNSVSGSYTQGSVIFAGASGILTEDNTNFYWDDANNLFGIQEGSPAHVLEINGTYAGNALVALVESGSNDILVASAGATTRARLTNDGNLYITGTLNTISGNLTIDSAGGTTTINDAANLGSSSTGVNVTTAGVLSDIDGNLVLNDTTDIGSATTGINVTTTGVLSDIDGNLVLNDTSDIGSTTTGIRVDADGTILDIDDTAVSVNDDLSVSGDLTVTGADINGPSGENIDLGEATANTTTFYISGTGELALTGSALTPVTASGLDLGSTTLPFQDLTLSSNFDVGGIISTIYNAISDSTTASYASTDNDLYIEDILEVGGSLYVGGVAVSTNSLWANSSNLYHPAGAYAGVADLAIGGSSTASADFVFQNINSGTPTLYAPAAAAIDFPEFDVSGTAGSVTINDGDDAGQLSVEGTVLDINSLDFVAAGSITSANSNALTLNAGGGDAAGEDLVITANNLSLDASGDISTANNAIAWTLDNVADALNFDSNTLSIDALNNRVGVGTNAPLYDLDIRGSATVSARLGFAPNFSSDQPTCNSNSEGSIYYDAVQQKHYYCNGTTWNSIAQGGSTEWTLSSGVVFPNSATTDLAVGGTTLAGSIFGIDEAAGNFYFGYDNSANPTLLFEATDGDAGSFGFNTNDSFYFSDANVGIGDTNPTALFTVGAGNPFQVDTSGLLSISAGTSTAITLTRTAAGQWVSFNDGTDTWGIYNTAGSPEGSLTANTGALSMDTSNGTLYVKVGDTSNTGWVNLATGGSTEWTLGSGILYPNQSTADVLIGGTATASSKFAFINNLTGTPTLYAPSAAAIDFPEFDVSGTDGSITINDGSNAGQVSVEGSVLDINSLTFVGAGELATANSSALTLNAGGGDAAGEDLVITANNLSLLATGALSITPDAALTTGLDITDTDLVNGLALGANFALFDNIRVFEGTTGTLTFENTAGDDLLNLTVESNYGNATASGSLASENGILGINSDASANNILTYGSVAGGAAGGSLYWGNDLLCDPTLTDCGWMTSASNNDLWQLGTQGLAPYNTTLDLYVGGTATQAATIALLSNSGNIYGDGVFSFGDSTPDENVFNTIGTGDADEGAINDAQDLYISDSLEVDGTIYAPALYQGANQVCDTSGNCIGGSGGSKWTFGTDAKEIAPFNTSLDVLVGGTATSTASFQAFGIENATGNVAALTSDTITSGSVLSATASAITSGTILKLGEGGNQTFSGNVLWADIDNTGGGGNAFTGNFLKFDNAQSTVFTVNSAGSITINNSGNTGQISVEGSIFDIDSLTFVGAGTIGSTTTGLTLDSGDNTLVIAADNTTLTAQGLATIDAADTLGIDSTTLNLGNGSPATIGTISDDNLTLAPNGIGNVILDPTGTGAITLTTTNTSASAIDLNATGIVSGNAVTVDTTDGGIAFTAGGASNGDITLTSADNIVIDVADTASLLFSDYANCTYLYTGTAGVLSCGSSALATASDIYWTQNDATGVLNPKNSTVDVLFGGTASASAQARIQANGEILVTPTSALTTGLDITDTDLVNGLALGANFALFDNIRVFEGTTGTLTFENTAGDDLLNLTVESNYGNATVSGSLAANSGIIGINSDANINNALTYGSVVGQAGGSLYWGNDLLCDPTLTNCGWLANASNNDLWQLGNQGLAPYNTTLDLYVGGTSTAAAKFNAKALEATDTVGLLALNSNTITSGTVADFSFDALTTGIGLNLDANLLTEGQILNVSSTSPNLTTGNLGLFDWSPSAWATASGDLFKINLGEYGDTTGNLFAIYDNSSELFSVDTTKVTSNLPTEFTASGDVTMAYDLNFTNQTAAEINTKSPFSIIVGDSYESNDLTLSTYNYGNIILDTGSSGGKVSIGSSITPQGLLTVDNTNTNAYDKALLVLNQDELQNIITASASGYTRFNLSNYGNATASGSLASENGILGINSDASANNILTYGSVAGGAAGGSLYWGNDLLCDPTLTNCGWATSASNNDLWQLGTQGIAPYNLTLDTYFGGTATASAQLRLAGVETTDGNVLAATSDTITSGSVLSATASAITSGTILKLGEGGNQTFSGNVLWADIDNTGGGGNSFTGNFLRFDNAQSTVFTVNSAGSITINNAGNTGSVSVEGTVLDINSLDFTATGAITTTDTNALTLNVAGGDNSAEDLLITANNTTLDSNGLLSVADLNLGLNDTSATIGVTDSENLTINVAGGDASGEDLVITANNIGLLATGALSITPDAALTTGLDVTDTDLLNALNLGANFELFNNIRVFEGTEGILTFENTAGNDLLNLTVESNYGNATASGSLASNTGIIGINSDANINNALTYGSVVGQAGGSLYWGNDLLCDPSLTNCGYQTIAGNNDFWQLGTQGIAPYNTTLDTYFGGTATSSAIARLAGIETAGGNILDINSSAITSGTVFDLTNTSLTTGKLLNIQSTSPNLSSGNLGLFDWSPSAWATASGDLFKINLGEYGDTTGNLFAIYDNSSELFSVDTTKITSALPHEFTASGDVSMAYDLILTNQTASDIESYGPLSIKAGEAFESNNLTLKTYNAGNIILDTSPTGHVLVGATGSAALKFNVHDVQISTASAIIENADTGSTADGLVIKLGFTGNGSAGNHFISFLNGNGVEMGSIKPDTTGGISFDASGNDIAEYFTKEDSYLPSPGDVVEVNESTSKIKSTDSEYAGSMIGIVSTAPGFIGGKDGPDKVLVGLVGQVPVKVASYSQAIQAGDYVTSSNQPGKAMKAQNAGRMIGTALESWTPGSGTDKIIVLLNNSWNEPIVAFNADGDVKLADDVLNPGYKTLTDGNGNSVSKLSLANLIAANVKIAVADVTDTLSALQIKAQQVLTGKLEVRNALNQTVASIDNQGNATFSGQLSANGVQTESASISGQLNAGTIYANEIIADAATFTDTATANLFGITRDQIEELLTQSGINTDLVTQTQNWINETATGSASFNDLASENIFVTGTGAFDRLSASTSFVIGNDLVISPSGPEALGAGGLQLNTIDTLNNPLSIQSSASQPLYLMAGLVKVNTNGDIEISGNLKVAGNIESKALKLTGGGQQTPSILSVTDENGSEIASVNASGSAQFNNVLAGTISLQSDATATTSANLDKLTLTTEATAGVTTIKQGYSEITIKNSKVKPTSLIFITPKTNTGNANLYLKSQADSAAVIGFDSPTEFDIEFNWWIVQQQ